VEAFGYTGFKPKPKPKPSPGLVEAFGYTGLNQIRHKFTFISFNTFVIEFQAF